MLEPEGKNTFKIAIATDSHLGFLESDVVRGADSFTAFEEFLEMANREKVDLILLGGDLFHECRPSQSCIYKTLSLLRKHCLGDGSIAFDFVSDGSKNFPDAFGEVNYRVNNYNVKIPVFSIHGNHDDPSGPANLSPLDLLSVSGLVNYFGRQMNYEEIVMDPILLKKGTSHLALYGLGNIRDERLYETFSKKKVKLLKPIEEDWFNLMLVHQNRTEHSTRGYLPEQYLESWMDLIFWGHEHECIIEPTLSGNGDFYITQPGSSVATSLCEAEAVTKHVGILRIQGHQFHIEPARLQTVRPFVMDTLILSESGIEMTDQDGIKSLFIQKVEDMIQRAHAQWNETPRPEGEEVPKPLIRLKVEYPSDFNIFNSKRFGQQFSNRVANPADILLFYRKKVPSVRKPKQESVDINQFVPDKIDALCVQDLVSDFLSAQSITLFPENAFSESVREFVDKEDKDAIKRFCTDALKLTRGSVSAHSSAVEDGSKVIDPDRVKLAQDLAEDTEAFSKEISRLKQIEADKFESVGSRDPVPSASLNDVKESKNKRAKRGESSESEGNENESEEDEDEEELPVSRKGKERVLFQVPLRANRSKPVAKEMEDTQMDHLDDPESPAPKSKKRALPPSVGPSSSQPAKKPRVAPKATTRAPPKKKGKPMVQTTIDFSASQTQVDSPDSHDSRMHRIESVGSNDTLPSFSDLSSKRSRKK